MNNKNAQTIKNQKIFIPKMPDEITGYSFFYEAWRNEKAKEERIANWEYFNSSTSCYEKNNANGDQ